jgi:predicted molibdopterin-dependent oxidoreductase YjgC
MEPPKPVLSDQRAVYPQGRGTAGPGTADWEIIGGLPRRMGYDMNYGSPAEVFEEIGTAYATYAGMTYGRMDACDLQWPCPDIDQPGTPYLHEDTFPRGRGRLIGIEDEVPVEPANEEYTVLLTTSTNALSVQRFHQIPDPGSQSARTSHAPRGLKISARK